MSGFPVAAVPRIWGEEFLADISASIVVDFGARFLAGCPLVWAGVRASKGGACFSVENVHLVLVETFGAAELQSLLARSEVKVLFGVADMFAPVADLRQRGQRSDISVDLQHQSG